MPLGFAELVFRAEEPSPRACAPPSGFRAAAGVRSAWPIGDGPFGRTPQRGGTAAQKAGRRYERHALKFLANELGSAFKPSQWFKFVDKDAPRLRFCQVDGLLHDASGLVIFEVKTSFTPDAWWQLRRLYEPVLAKAFCVVPQLVIVCKSFDPAVPFPEEIVHLQLAAGWREVLGKRVGVFQWRP